MSGMLESPRPPWPEPIEIISPAGRSPIVLICEHASNYIPAEYAGLGLTPRDLLRHIAWDIGVAAVVRTLSKLLDAPAFLGTYSRLLIDLNRPPRSAGSIPTRSEATAIPGNQGLPTSEQEARVQRIFQPFQTAIAKHLDDRERARQPTLIVCMHSFTPVYLGESRPWHVGVLFDKGIRLARHIISGIQREDAALNVGANVPYNVSADEDYAVLVHGDHRRIPAALIELRHDLIAHTHGAELWAARLAKVLRAAAQDTLLEGNSA